MSHSAMRPFRGGGLGVGGLVSASAVCLPAPVGVLRIRAFEGVAWLLAGCFAIAGAVGVAGEALEIRINAGVAKGVIASYRVSASSPQVAGQGWVESVQALNGLGQLVSGATTQIQLANSGRTVFYADGTYAVPVTSVQLQNGQATLYVKDNKAETIVLSVTDAQGIAGQSGAIVVKPKRPSKVTFQAQPQGAQAGSPLAQQPQVFVSDEFDNGAEGAPVVAVVLAKNPGGAVLGGTTSVQAQGGLAAFTDLTVSAPGDGYTLQVTVDGLGAESAGFSVLPGNGGGEGGPPGGKPLTVGKVAIQLVFSQTGKDLIALSGSLPVVEGWNPDGEGVEVEVGGVAASFQLDGRGRDVSPSGSLRLRLKRKKGVVQAGTAAFVLRLGRGTFRDLLADEGLLDETVQGKQVQVLVQVTLAGVVYKTGQTAEGDRPLLLRYDALEGKKGVAKK